ncbi:MAG TPA: ATP-grasp domain-containing protein [Bryobacteraceae bacterium]
MTINISLKPHVFVTDGSYLHTLAAVRALGQSGSRITVGERNTVPGSACIAFRSKYCSDSLVYPDPIDAPQQCVAALRDYFAKHPVDAFLPISLDMNELVVRHAAEFNVPVLIPPLESFIIASDKEQTFDFAGRLGIPVPRTVSGSEYRLIGAPCVFKHRRRGARIAHSQAEADAIAQEVAGELGEYLVQTYIPGRNGFGYFGLFLDGREAGFFMHERLMQYPIEGGPSVVARSVYDEQLREYGKRLLEALRWNGVAMVEFKKSSADGQFYLMEINPKFWGSLALAIHAGADFPTWVRDVLLHHELPTPPKYRLDAKYHWIVPHELKCFARYPEYRWRFVQNLLDPQMASEISLLDPLPTVALLAHLGRRALKPRAVKL